MKDNLDQDLIVGDFVLVTFSDSIYFSKVEIMSKDTVIANVWNTNKYITASAWSVYKVNEADAVEYILKGGYHARFT